jgi:RPA family protein
MKRELAWRVFAGEYNDSVVEIKGDGEMSPSYVVTPLGAKINRLFIIGVLTDVETISEGGDLLRAHISDPTGVFTLYSGSYQKDATNALNEIEIPAFVAVIGKVRTYSPEEGTLFVSIRPEKIIEVSSQIRDKWILETCKNTKDRIRAIIEAKQMDDSDENKLRKLGYSRELSEGVIEAINNYSEKIDLNKYVNLIQESLQYLIQGNGLSPNLVADQKEGKKIKTADKTNDVDRKKQESTDKIEVNDKVILKNEESTDLDIEEESDNKENEKKVFDIIKKIEDKDGAAWDIITEKCKNLGLDKDLIEEVLSSLMDKGLIYEPVLGTIKTT